MLTVAYLEDPDDIDLNGEFDGVNEDEVEDLNIRKFWRFISGIMNPKNAL